MREIKFRVWSKTANEMYNWTKILSHHNKLINYFQWNDMYELMQYIGLKDKNGKEIYEGDIVKEQDLIGYIEYYHNRFLAMAIGGSVFTPGNRCEIIGNLYENPELIKEIP